MNRIYMHTTRGVCPECNRIVDAKVYSEDNKVYLEKYCMDHGRSAAMVSSDYSYYKEAHKYIKPGQNQSRYFGETINGCPYDCGICPDHEQHICMPVLEITGNCNLDCPICIAHEDSRENLSMDQIKAMVDRLLESEGKIDVLNISGGEPTLHPEYEMIIEHLTTVEEITKISVSTNGLTLLKQDGLLAFHKENGVIISLQLDGVGKEVYTRLRGHDLMEKKRRIVDALISHDVDCSIIAVIARGINDTMEDVEYLYRLFMANENILSLLFQPLVHAKEMKSKTDAMDRVTIPDVIRLVSGASNNIVRKSDFMPLPCCHAACFSLVHLLKIDDGKYIPMKRFLDRDRYIETIKNRSFFGSDEDSFRAIKDIIFSIWADGDEKEGITRETTEKALRSIKKIIKEVDRANCNCGSFLSKKAFDAGSRKIKSIYIHHFMDVDTFDLTRARRCCTVYPKPDGKFYPMCTFNNLYRN